MFHDRPPRHIPLGFPTRSLCSGPFSDKLQVVKVGKKHIHLSKQMFKNVIQLKTFYSVAQLRLSDIDYCTNVTCNNGGSCVDGLSNYSCFCVAGYTGIHCETGIRN